MLKISNFYKEDYIQLSFQQCQIPLIISQDKFYQSQGKQIYTNSALPANHTINRTVESHKLEMKRDC